MAPGLDTLIAKLDELINEMFTVGDGAAVMVLLFFRTVVERAPGKSDLEIKTMLASPRRRSIVRKKDRMSRLIDDVVWRNPKAGMSEIRSELLREASADERARWVLEEGERGSPAIVLPAKKYLGDFQSIGDAFAAATEFSSNVLRSRLAAAKRVAAENSKRKHHGIRESSAERIVADLSSLVPTVSEDRVTLKLTQLFIKTVSQSGGKPIEEALVMLAKPLRGATASTSDRLSEGINELAAHDHAFDTKFVRRWLLWQAQRPLAQRWVLEAGGKGKAVLFLPRGKVLADFESFEDAKSHANAVSTDSLRSRVKASKATMLQMRKNSAVAPEKT